jgi:hypothetical protein
LPLCDPLRGLEQLGSDDREALEMICHYLDNVGTLVAQGLLRPEPAAAFLGGSATGMWRTTAPFILAERKVNDRPTYQRHFEHLVSVFERIPYKETINNLGRVAG